MLMTTNISIVLFIIKVFIFRVFFSFTKQFFTFNPTKGKFEKQILPLVAFEPTTSWICGKRLIAEERGPHNCESSCSSNQTLAANAVGRGF